MFIIYSNNTNLVHSKPKSNTISKN